MAGFCLFLLIFAPLRAMAEKPSSEVAKPKPVQDEVATLLDNLDSSHYETRQLAARRLERLIAKPELHGLLATEFQQHLLQPDVSFEVRWRVVRWRSRLPEATVAPPQTASPKELDRLVGQLDDDRYGVRLGAADRLQWVSRNPNLLGPIITRLKDRLADPALSSDAYQRLESVRQGIWADWLMSDRTDWNLPAVSADQLDGWLDDLVKPSSKSAATNGRLRQQVARQELTDLLAQDKETARVVAALKSRLAGSINAEGASQIRSLLELTQPAMAAEFWQDHKQLGVQHLFVNVPSQPPGAMRASHFDRIDDRVAHCVSGNSLSPGNYPVGVAFPHPIRRGVVMDLVNLPTPRRRIAYTYYLKTSAAQRLAALSRRTVDRFLAEKHVLNELEIDSLEQLDRKEVSRFAGRYFLLVDDGRLDDDSESILIGRPRSCGYPSRNGAICAQLAVNGTRDAIPGLLEAIEQKRLLPPTSLAPYQLAWLAALTIAQRDPWPNVDSWLAASVGNGEPLVMGQPDGPTIGATAARLLLKRHHEPPEAFGLTTAPESFVTSHGLEGCRFKSPDDGKQVQAWWQQQSKTK